MSYREIAALLSAQGHSVSVSSVKKYGRKYKLSRTPSEAKRQLDWSISCMTPPLLEVVDGLMLSDGHISKYPCALSGSFKYVEFRDHLSAFFTQYKPAILSGHNIDEKGIKHTFYRFNTKCHPDFQNQRSRWYNVKKIVPHDVSISPTSVLIWFLGDGYFSKKHTFIRLSTNSFTRRDVDFLVRRLNAIGIICARIKSRVGYEIRISSDAVPFFFQYIGSKSPVQCYSYKFEIPEWLPFSTRIDKIYKMHNISRYKCNKAVVDLQNRSPIANRLSPNGRIWVLNSFVNEIVRMAKQ